MELWPEARRLEFEALVQTAAIPPGAPLIVDVPSGGGYLKKYLPENARLILLDPSAKFLESATHEEEATVICSPHDAIPLEDASVDVVLSLAGIHHLKDPAAAYREWHRLLKPGGVLAIGDVEAGSGVHQFLDRDVVRAFNSMGHSGQYLNDEQAALIGTIGFDIEVAGVKACPWVFKQRKDLLDFCRTLFALDQEPEDTDLLNGIDRSVGYRENRSECRLNWELYFIRAVKQ